MLILLPPSQGKTAPAAGPPVDLASLTLPHLADARRAVGDALATVSARRNALATLGAGASRADEVTRNATIWTNPSAPAARVYAGVLYDAAGMASWDATALAHAAQRVLITSALWGVVTPADRIPAYRLSAGTTLGRLGNVTSFWRARLRDAIPAHDLIVDCRSGSYAAMWTAARHQTVAVRVVREAGGRRTVVSHFAKHWRGLLTRHLLAQPRDPATPDDVAALAADLPGVRHVEQSPSTITLVTVG